MKLTISQEESGEVFSADIPETLTLEDFQAYIHAESGVEPEHQTLLHNSRTVEGLVDSKTKQLSDLGIEDGLLLVLRRRKQDNSSTNEDALGAGAGAGNHTEAEFGLEEQQFEEMRRHILGNPSILAQLPPQVQGAVNNPEQFAQILRQVKQQNSSSNGEGANFEELRRLEQDPDDPENQKRILELIRQKQVEENMMLAWDILPESFTQVDMLYINMKVNGLPVKAFVDTGAQVTLMDPKFAAKAGLEHLIDSRFINVAKGAGSQTTKGKIHSVPITIGDSDLSLPCLFTVLETGVEVLFGLDMMRRHRCVIDLEKSILTVGGNIETKFLNGPELPLDSIFNNQAPTALLGGNLFSPGEVAIPHPVRSSGASGVAGFSGAGSSTTSSTRNSSSTPAVGAAGAAAAARHNKIPRTTPSTSSTPAASTTSNAATTSIHGEEKISQLVGLGFSRREAISALDLTDGNIDMAAALLFG